MKSLHKCFLKALFFIITILALNPIQGFCEPQCIKDGTVCILSPFSWQRPGRSELVQEMKSKLQQRGYVEGNITIKENTDGDQAVTLDDYVDIRNGEYSIAIVLTHSNGAGKISTGIPLEKIDDNLYVKGFRVTGSNNLFGTSTVTGSDVEYLGLKPAFWDGMDLSGKALLFSSCSLLSPTYQYDEITAQGFTIIKYDGRNPIIDIFNQANAGGIFGFENTIHGNYGVNFIANYLLQEIVENTIDLASAVDTAKVNYNESDDPGTPNAGEAAKRIGGEDFYLACVPPVLDVTINGFGVGPVEVPINQPYEVTFTLDPGTYTGQLADYWFYMESPTGELSPLMGPSFEAIQQPIEPLEITLPGFAVGLEKGNYTFHFAVDDNADGLLDGTWSDSVVMKVTESMDLVSGLAASYPFNGNASDMSGNGNNGIVTGATLTSDRFGNANSAYSFDGNDYIMIGNRPSLKMTSAMSLSVWVKPDNIQTEGWGGAGFILSDGRDCCSNTGGMGFHLANNQHTRGYVWSRDRLIEMGGPVMTPEEWHHLVFIFDGSSLKIYQDNMKVKETSFPATSIKPSAYNMYIGALNAFGSPYSPYNFHGEIDDLRLYNRAINESEIKALYIEQPEALLTAVNIAKQTAIGQALSDTIDYLYITHKLKLVDSIDGYGEFAGGWYKQVAVDELYCEFFEQVRISNTNNANVVAIASTIIHEATHYRDMAEISKAIGASISGLETETNAHANQWRFFNEAIEGGIINDSQLSTLRDALSLEAMEICYNCEYLNEDCDETEDALIDKGYASEILSDETTYEDFICLAPL